MLKEKDGLLKEGVQVSIIHRWRNELVWSSIGTKYCQLIREANLEKRLLVTRLINHHSVRWSVGRSVCHSVSRLVGWSVSRSTPVNWTVFYKKYRTCKDSKVHLKLVDNNPLLVLPYMYTHVKIQMHMWTHTRVCLQTYNLAYTQPHPSMYKCWEQLKIILLPDT